jgi:teichuronic acid biosynthesis glycosyltransferase TuaC
MSTSESPLRIAFLCKRRYMGKDVIHDRYARLYEIPFQLARIGHSVVAICLDYHEPEQGLWEHEGGDGRLTWISRSTGRFVLPGLGVHVRETLRHLQQFMPNLLIGASDIPHAALVRQLAQRLCRPYAIDLYDNFESFGQARIPGMKTMLRGAVRNAALVTTTSQALATYVQDHYRPKGEVLPIPSTVDKRVFHRRDRTACRSRLGLPERARLVGTAGGLHRDKGVGVLYEAWRQLAAEAADLHLVLAGPHDRTFPPPSDPRVHYLGELPHAQTPDLFSALDVGVIYVRDTPFGRYCFPQKAYEMLACGLPVVSARVGAMVPLLAGAPQCLYEPDNASDLATTIRRQLNAPVTPSVAIDDWQTVIGRLEPRLRAIARSHSPN